VAGGRARQKKLVRHADESGEKKKRTRKKDWVSPEKVEREIAGAK